MVREASRHVETEQVGFASIICNATGQPLEMSIEIATSI